MLNEAIAYNRTLLQKENRYHFSEEDEEEYNSILDVTGTGIMAYVEIPSISVSLPIYHSTNEDVLQTAIGHIEGTSLPVGGLGTHCAVSGHRGLPAAKLFTDLDQLKEGDTFLIQVLNRTLTYEVDQIRIVLPTEMQDLEIDRERRTMCVSVRCACLLSRGDVRFLEKSLREVFELREAALSPRYAPSLLTADYSSSRRSGMARNYPTEHRG